MKYDFLNLKCISHLYERTQNISKSHTIWRSCPASIYKHYDDLSTSLSQLKFNFDIIAITEHKIKNDSPYQNVELPGYHEFIFDPTLTSHGSTRFYVKESLTYKMRNFYRESDNT